jgi:hypothetical protein
MVPAFVRRAMIPIGVAGFAIGIYDATSGSPVEGGFVGLIGLAAASLAIVKLRAARQWSFK